MARITPNIPDPQDYGVTSGVTARPTSVGGRGFQIVGADQRIPMPAEFEAGRAMQQFSATLAQFGRVMESTWAAEDQEKVDQFLLEMEGEEEQLIKLEKEGGLPAGWNPRTQRYYNQRRAEDFAEVFIQDKLKDPELLAALSDPDQKDNASIRQRVQQLKGEFFEGIPNSLSTSLEFSKTFDDLTSRAVTSVIDEGIKQSGINRKAKNARRFQLDLKKTMREAFTGGVFDALQDYGVESLAYDRKEGQTVEEAEKEALDLVINGLINEYQRSHALAPGELSATVFEALADVADEFVEVEDPDGLDQFIDALENLELEGTSMPEREELLAKIKIEATKLDSRLEGQSPLDKEIKDVGRQAYYWASAQMEGWYGSEDFSVDTVRAQMGDWLDQQGVKDPVVRAAILREQSLAVFREVSGYRNASKQKETEEQAIEANAYRDGLDEKVASEQPIVLEAEIATLDQLYKEGKISAEQIGKLKVQAHRSARINENSDEILNNYRLAVSGMVKEEASEIVTALTELEEDGDPATLGLRTQLDAELATVTLDTRRKLRTELAGYIRENGVIDEDGNAIAQQFFTETLMPKYRAELKERKKELYANAEGVVQEAMRIAATTRAPAGEVIGFVDTSLDEEMIDKMAPRFRGVFEPISEATKRLQDFTTTVRDKTGKVVKKGRPINQGILDSVFEEVEKETGFKMGAIYKQVGAKQKGTPGKFEMFLDPQASGSPAKYEFTIDDAGEIALTKSAAGAELPMDEDEKLQVISMVRTTALMTRKSQRFTSEEYLNGAFVIDGKRVPMTDTEVNNSFGTNVALILSKDEVVEAMQAGDDSDLRSQTVAFQVFEKYRAENPAFFENTDISDFKSFVMQQDNLRKARDLEN